MPEAEGKLLAGKGHSSRSKARRTRRSPTSHRGDPERLPLVQSDTRGSGSGAHHTHPLNTEMIPVGHTPSSPSQPQPLGSFFQNSQNFGINGGEFTSSQLHTNLTINIGGSATSGSDNSVEMNVISVGEVQLNGERNVSRASASQGTIRMQESSGNNFEGNHKVASEASGSAYARDSDNAGGNLHVRQESRLLTPLPIQKSSDIYFRHLAAKGRGSPLWNPEPNSMLPIEYQRHGIGIGDVGIITDSGGFDFLFNICLPEGDPINPETMPLNFKPLAYPRSRDLYVSMEYKADSYLASSSVESSRHNKDGSQGLVFESSDKDGAVLTMPAGSKSVQLRNVTAFRKYAIENAESWYQYANGVCGREAENGDLRLVVGHHSASAWGMAAFSSISEQSAFRLKFTRNNNESDSVEPSLSAARKAAYEWECSGTAVEVKSGPDPREVEILHSPTGDEISTPYAYENQSLFIRTINVTLQDDVWNKLSADWEMDIGVDGHAFGETEAPSLSRAGDILGGHAMGASDGARNQTHTSEASGRETERRGVSDNITMHDQIRQHGDPIKHSSCRDGVHISCPPGALNLHPSTAINRYLLKARPNMRMAVTEDTDWISVLHFNETVLPPSGLLFYRVVLTHDIFEDDGAVFFGPLSIHSSSTPTPSGDDISELPELDTSTFLSLYSLESADDQWSTSSPVRPPGPVVTIPGTIASEQVYPTPLNSVASAGVTQRNESDSLHNLVLSHRQQLSHLDHLPRHPDHAISLIILANTLNVRYNKLGNAQDLEESISLYKDVLNLCPPGHLHYSKALGHLANALSTRYKQWGKIEDLEKSIFYYRQNLHCDWNSVSPRELANALSTRYNQLGKIEDLEESISLYRDAVGDCPCERYEHAMSLSDLASALNTRYNKLGRIEDLEESICGHRQALFLCPPGHPDHAVLLNKLANALIAHYDRLRKIEYLEESICCYRQALTLRPPGHPHHVVALKNLANALSTRYNESCDADHMEESLALYRDALTFCPPGHPDHAVSLSGLADALNIRYNKLGNAQDLEESISLYKDVLNLCPSGHPDHALSLNNLANALVTRYNKSGNSKDLKDSLLLRREAVTNLHRSAHPRPLSDDYLLSPRRLELQPRKPEKTSSEQVL